MEGDYRCIKGFVSGTTACTINDEINILFIHNTESRVQVIGKKGTCKDWEFEINKEQLVEHFILNA